MSKYGDAIDMEELFKLLSEVNNNVCRTPKEVGENFLLFKRVVEDFNNLPDAEKHEIIKNFFINNPEDCIEFANRHPNCIYNKYIKQVR